jgi:hypothetical protein
MVSSRVRLGGAKSASPLWRTSPSELFLKGNFFIFERFLPKRAMKGFYQRELSETAPLDWPERQKGLTLTLTIQPLK